MERVLLVDDTGSAIARLKAPLEAAGYSVVAIERSARLLPDRVAALAPDVIIIDTDSPTRDVLEQVCVVSEHTPRPIVLFTDDASRSTMREAIKSGISAYVVAGMQPERLRPMLEVASVRFEEERRLREELRDTKTQLADRKLIERAKGLLMQQRGCSETEAFQLMRKHAMDNSLKLRDVAERLIAMCEMLSKTTSL